MAQAQQLSTAPARQQPISYHHEDFTWESLRDRAQPLLAQQEAEVEAAAAAAAAVAQPPSGTTASMPAGHGANSSSWEAFHQQHASGRFFRPKRYLTAEFGQLAAPGIHILDIGAGNGASVVPILAANPSARATCCDISSTALRLLQASAGDAGVANARIVTRLLDASADDAALPLDASADVALLVFTLSAVPPERMANVLRLAHASLRRGGLLLFRDYAQYDLPQLRFAPGAYLGRNLYRREDGTLAYFFSASDLQQRACAAGFEVLECKYACVVNTNRRTGEALQRAFVHGVFQKS